MLDIGVARTEGTTATEKAERRQHQSWFQATAVVDLPRTGSTLELVEADRVLATAKAGGAGKPVIHEARERVGNKVRMTVRATHPDSDGLWVTFHENDGRGQFAMFQPALFADSRIVADFDWTSFTFVKGLRTGIVVRASDGFNVVEAQAGVVDVPSR